ncbi:hypothetical protein QYE76_015813 [Lolium multiflorum]|uniref:Nucleotide-diphospho-sugar transferase domain-containing protein n=1 Tax=Lolium multiflorum TaxID=4521 RepID=A0AAD8U541_LOLMU|nr:hypothetical protein QYE76_015813 [Lolium multiflorum]
MLPPSHGHRRPPLPRRRGAPCRRSVRGSSSRSTSPRLAGCLLVALIAFVVLAGAVLRRASSSSARSHHPIDEHDRPTAGPRITIFSAPLVAPDGSPARQELAVRSWLALRGNVSVVLLGSHPSAIALSARLGRRVTVEVAVDFSFTGTPFFHSMVARAQSSDSDICVLVDADVVLLPETVTLLTNLSRIDRDWLLVSMSRNTSSLNEEVQADNWAADSGDRGLIMAWNNPRNPLLGGVLPSFLYGRGEHSWWLIHEVLSSEMRLVLDASSLVLGLHPEDFSAKRGSSDSGRLLDGSWEYGVNRHLAAVYGSYCYRSLRRHHSPMLYEVVKHSEDYMLSKVEEPTFPNFVIGKEHIVHAEGDSLRKKENICLPGHLLNYSSENPDAAGVPYSLGMLLQFVADQNRSVVLGVAGASYRDMLMSWVCRLRHLGVTNFVVCALDQETYEFSILQFLHSLGPATFAAQTDEYNETGPINLPRRLNSGFYYARSDHATISTMEMVVKHATKSNSSEQPSFYDILCGKEGVNRLGDDRCLEPSTNLTVVFLDRDLFPNGAYRGLWERHDIPSVCRELGCFVIHNNWVNGRRKKLQRQMASGLWDYDPSSRMCLQSWGGAGSFRVMGQFHALNASTKPQFKLAIYSGTITHLINKSNPQNFTKKAKWNRPLPRKDISLSVT